MLLQNTLPTIGCLLYYRFVAIFLFGHCCVLFYLAHCAEVHVCIVACYSNVSALVLITICVFEINYHLQTNHTHSSVGESSDNLVIVSLCNVFRCKKISLLSDHESYDRGYIALILCHDMIFFLLVCICCDVAMYGACALILLSSIPQMYDV